MPHRPAALLAALVLAVAGMCAAPAVAAEPPIVLVGPHQSFSGTVNGATVDATITMICAGPIATGHPRDGKTVGVRQVTGPASGPVTSVGYTGDRASSIAAGLSDASTTASPIAVFTAYEDQTLSTKLSLPCSGTGTVVFLPSPDSGGRPARVTVRFVSIGV